MWVSSPSSSDPMPIQTEPDLANFWVLMLHCTEACFNVWWHSHRNCCMIKHWGHLSMVRFRYLLTYYEILWLSIAQESQICFQQPRLCSWEIHMHISQMLKFWENVIFATDLTPNCWWNSNPHSNCCDTERLSRVDTDTFYHSCKAVAQDSKNRYLEVGNWLDTRSWEKCSGIPNETYPCRVPGRYPDWLGWFQSLAVCSMR